MFCLTLPNLPCSPTSRRPHRPRSAAAASLPRPPRWAACRLSPSTESLSPLIYIPAPPPLAPLQRSPAASHRRSPPPSICLADPVRLRINASKLLSPPNPARTRAQLPHRATPGARPLAARSTINASARRPPRLRGPLFPLARPRLSSSGPGARCPGLRRAFSAAFASCTPASAATRRLRASPAVSMGELGRPCTSLRHSRVRTRARPPSPCSAGAASPSPRSSASRSYRSVAGRASVSLRASTGVRGSVRASSAGGFSPAAHLRRPGAHASSAGVFSPAAHLPGVPAPARPRPGASPRRRICPAPRHAPLLFATGHAASTSRGSSFDRALHVRAGARVRTAWPALAPPAPGAPSRLAHLAALAVPMRAPVAGFVRVSSLALVSDVLSAAASPASRAPPCFEHLARLQRLGSYAPRASSLAPVLHIVPASWPASRRRRDGTG
jgi:hypothetical protein